MRTSLADSSGTGPQDGPYASWRVAILEGFGVAATMLVIVWLSRWLFQFPMSYAVVGSVGGVWVVYRRWWPLGDVDPEVQEGATKG